MSELRSPDWPEAVQKKRSSPFPFREKASLSPSALKAGKFSEAGLLATTSGALARSQEKMSPLPVASEENAKRVPLADMVGALKLPLTAVEEINSLGEALPGSA
jgi:hypothetical protein